MAAFEATITTYDNGTAIWRVRSGDHDHWGHTNADGDGSKARAAVVAYAGDQVVVERRVSSMPTFKPYPGDIVLDPVMTSIVLDQLPHGAFVIVKNVTGVSDGSGKAISNYYAATMLEHRRPLGTYEPKNVLELLIDRETARMLIESGAHWEGDHALDPRGPDATVKELMDELAVGGAVGIRHVSGARRDEFIDEVRSAYRAAYRLTSRSVRSGGRPMYARVTVAEANELSKAGAKWFGDGPPPSR